MTLKNRQIKDLIAKYGAHKFCYQCGNPDIKPCDPPNTDLYYCPKCGSSDEDE